MAQTHAESARRAAVCRGRFIHTYEFVGGSYIPMSSRCVVYLPREQTRAWGSGGCAVLYTYISAANRGSRRSGWETEHGAGAQRPAIRGQCDTQPRMRTARQQPPWCELRRCPHARAQTRPH